MTPATTEGVRQVAHEVERSLVITAPDPERVYRRLIRLRHVGAYALRARGAEHIVDRYFDTQDGALAERGLALRLRSVNGLTVLGIKGPRKRSSTRTEDRLERERPYSREALDDVRRRVRLPRADIRSPAFGGNDPDAVVQAELGVRLVQRRETVRVIRDALDAREEAPVLAEVALDRVRFEIGGRSVRHYEVEVEAKRTGRGTRAATRIAEHLLARYPELAEWPYGKLATGTAIERLAAESALDGLGPDGALTARSYEQIRTALTRPPRR